MGQPQGGYKVLNPKRSRAAAQPCNHLLQAKQLSIARNIFGYFMKAPYPPAGNPVRIKQKPRPIVPPFRKRLSVTGFDYVPGFPVV
jgi:hypothetical protein